ncbi:MAG TPA: exodeoxyribonuclease VII large subunit [Dehalococcoidia bacterium]|nr:exodeoxyribonuclease VII large subunit [Dehalococcoidia bacterium]
MQVYSVREIATYLRELLESNTLLADIWIAGEASNVSRPSSGHTYFTLKDEHSALKAVFFASRYTVRRNTAHLIEQGHAIVAHGRVSLYEARGDIQFYVDFVQPEGAGALQAEFERLKAQLAEEGLFDESRKRPLPRMPRTIGVVTSASGAVFQDICHVLERRWPLAEVVLAPTPVQGPDAVAGIVGALDMLNARGDIDVIIAGRGGGSIEELWPFNDEAVARAIFGSGVPVVSAVGHETDYTIADYVADVRAPTPSAAAEIVAPDRNDVMARLAVAAGTMDSVLRQRLADARTGVSGAVHRIERRAPDLNTRRQRIDDVVRRAAACVDLLQREGVQQVGSCVWRLKALDPYATLDRGYAIVERAGKVVSEVGAVTTGDALSVRVKDGTFDATVGRPGRPQRRPKRKVPDAQAPLFTMPEERA